MANARVSRMFIQAASRRRSNTLCPVSTIFTRQLLSGSTAGFHTTAKVGEASEAHNLSEEASLTQPATKKTRRRTKVHEESAVEVDAKPRKTRRTRAQIPSDKSEESDAPKRNVGKRKLKSSPRASAHVKVPEIVAEVELPPVESWHRFFPVWKERTKHSRAVIREVDTADMLAKACVPRGSRDMTVIEVSPGIFFLPVNRVVG